MSKITVILGTAHLRTTPGKRSVDGRLREYAYSREIVSLVEMELKKRGCDVVVDYRPTEPDKLMAGSSTKVVQNRELRYRVGKVNELCRKLGAGNCIYVSVHVNAAGGGKKWNKASGFSVFVSLNASESSKCLARSFTSLALERSLCGNRSIPKAKYWSKNLFVLRETLCPSVLTENLFQDNKADVDFLLSDEGREAIVRLHVDAIEEYLKGR